MYNDYYATVQIVINQGIKEKSVLVWIRAVRAKSEAILISGRDFKEGLNIQSRDHDCKIPFVGLYPRRITGNPFRLIPWPCLHL